MGKIRRKAVLTKCAECDAQENQPCIHKRTGKPMKNHHKSRTWSAKEVVLNREVAHIEGHERWEEFWKWVDRYLGLDPSDQYHGEF